LIPVAATDFRQFSVTKESTPSAEERPEHFPILILSEDEGFGDTFWWTKVAVYPINNTQVG